MTAVTQDTSEARIAKALAHPLRARILERLSERVLSPGDLALELGAPLGVVSYHVRMLRDYSCVELVRTEPRRGALQHFYRAVATSRLDADTLRELPAALRGELASEVMQAIVADIAEASASESFADPAALLMRVPLELDERGRKKLSRLLHRTAEQALGIAQESADREPDSTENVTLGLLHFRRP